MLTDPIADMLIQIKNGYGADKKTVGLPWSKTKENLAGLLVKSGYLVSYEIFGEGAKKEINMTLKYDGKTAAFMQVERVSKPSLRVYADKNHLPRVVWGMGVAIISTPKGLMTDKEARRAGLGGEVWCKIW